MSTSPSLARVPLLLLATAGLHRCLTNPNPPVSDDELKTFTGSTSYANKIITWWPNILKYGLWTGALCESAVILCSHFPYPPYTSRLLALLVPYPSSVPRIRLTTPFVVGALLAGAGSFVRYQCYLTLGRHFTYQLAFRPDHTLVTAGPYAWVRHPSYAAFVLAFAGMCACWFGRGSWLVECGVLDTALGRAVTGVALVGGLGLDYVCLSRPAKEDEGMRRKFGQEWEEWAERVPYRLIPYVY